MTRCANRIPWLPSFHTFDIVRTHSPLLLAAICSVGARACNEHQDYRISISEAKVLARRTILPGGNTNLMDLKGLIALAAYHGMNQLIGHIVT
jgi:hypothetical protein